MLISSAYAFDAGVADTGSSGGGIALAIIVGTGIVIYILYSVWKRWGERKLDSDGKDQ